MGTIGDCFDNSVAESFFGTLQVELLDEHCWNDRQHLALAIFDWIEAWSRSAPPPLLLRDAQPRRLRDRQRGMITTPTPSARPGEPQNATQGSVHLRTFRGLLARPSCQSCTTHGPTSW
jgi:putative transposase